MVDLPAALRRIFGPDLGGDQGFAPAPTEGLGQNVLRLSIHGRGVEEVDAGGDRFVDDRRAVLVGVEGAPGAHSDRRHGQARASQLAAIHRPNLHSGQPMATLETARAKRALKAWRVVMSTCNAPAGASDVVTRWLVLTRACVQPMTLTSAAIAGLLAVRVPGFSVVLFALAALGIVLAHAANNLVNDIFDESLGADTADYPRALYAPHPVISGMATRRTLVTAFLVLNLLDLAILLVLTAYRGWPIIAFALLGLLGSVGYAAPVLRFKKRGLGEPVVFLVWGPLMVGGTYFAANGQLPWQVLAASIPYSILCTTVLFGRQIDKLQWDAPLRIWTRPLLRCGRAARPLTLDLMAPFSF